MTKPPPFLRRRLDLSRSALFRVEAGETKATTHLIRTMMDIYDRWEDGILDQARDANKPLWFRAYDVANGGYVDVETHAGQVCEFSGLNLPGLLQTEAYVRALLGSSHRKRTQKQIDNDVKVRLIRQRRLIGEDDPLELIAIVDEAARRREIGGPEVMRQQLGHLIEAAALPRVTVQAGARPASHRGTQPGRLD